MLYLLAVFLAGVQGASYKYDTHCGGQPTGSLEDGTPYGWVPPGKSRQKCIDKCISSVKCMAFVWRESDSKCFWKDKVVTWGSRSTFNKWSGRVCVYDLLNLCRDYGACGASHFGYGRGVARSIEARAKTH